MPIQGAYWKKGPSFTVRFSLFHIKRQLEIFRQKFVHNTSRYKQIPRRDIWRVVYNVTTSKILYFALIRYDGILDLYPLFVVFDYGLGLWRAY